MRRAFDAVDAFLIERDGDFLVDLALERFGTIGIIPLMVSALCVLSVGINLIVSPGAACTKLGSTPSRQPRPC
jgi:hypothetical protein